MAITAADLKVRLSTEGAKGVQSDLAMLGGAVDQTAKKSGFLSNVLSTGLGFVGAMGFMRVTDAAIGFGREMVNTGMTFEAQMSAVRAVTAASAEEMEQLTALALEIGKSTQFGATESALAIEELAKAGLSTTDILNGAADATAALAAAGGVDMPNAAMVMSAAMNQFGIAGDDAMMVADLLASASAISATGVLELGESLKYVGTQASAMGYGIEDITTALAIMADQGMVGSMAGTSLNQMLLNMANPTAKAKEAMAELGIAFTDVNGNMRPLPDILADVATATADMGDAQRAAYLETMFGVEGGRAMNALLVSQTEEAKAAGKSWKDYRKEITKSGVASEQAAARMDNTLGALEELGGSIETFSIMASMMFLPMLRGGIEWAGRFVDGLTDMMTAFDLARANGLEPFDAAMHALRVGLNEAFGPQVAATVVDTIRNIATALDAARTYASSLLQVFRADGLTGVLQTIGDDLAGLAIDLGSVAVRIGRWAIGAATDLGSAVWDWVTNTAIPAVGSVLAEIPSVAVSIGRWLQGTIPDLWDTVMGWFSGGGDAGLSGDGTGGAMPAREITLSSILVNITSWTMGEVADIGTAIREHAQPVAVDLGEWSLNVGAPNVAFIGWYPADKILEESSPVVANLTDWTLAVDAASVVDLGFNAADVIYEEIIKQPLRIPIAAAGITIAIIGLPIIAMSLPVAALGAAMAKHIPRSVKVNAAELMLELRGFGVAVVDLVKRVQDEIMDRIGDTINITDALNITFDVLGAIEFGFDLVDIVTQKAKDLLPDSISLPMPDISFSNPFGGGEDTWTAEDMGGSPNGGGKGLELPSFTSDLRNARVEIDLFKESSRGISDNLKAAFSEPLDVSGITNAFATIGATVTASALTIGSALTTGIAAGINLGAGTVSSAITSLVTTAGNARTGMMIAGLGAGGAFGTGTAAGIRLHTGSVASAVGTYVSTASAQRFRMLAAGIGVGAALGQGIAAGIRSMAGTVAAEAAAIVTTAIAAAKAAGGISSPSKVMRDQVGAMLGAGVERGIYDSLPGVERAGGQLVPTLSGSFAGSGTRSGVNVTVNVPTTINLPDKVSDAELLRIFQVYAKAQELATRTALQAEGVAA